MPVQQIRTGNQTINSLEIRINWKDYKKISSIFYQFKNLNSASAFIDSSHFQTIDLVKIQFLIFITCSCAIFLMEDMLSKLSLKFNFWVFFLLKWLGIRSKLEMLFVRVTWELIQQATGSLLDK